MPREQTPHHESHGDDQQLAGLHAEIERRVSNPSALSTSVTLCATVNAVIVQTSRRLNPTRNNSASTNSK